MSQTQAVYALDKHGADIVAAAYSVERRVLTIAESERRLVNLIAATAKAGGKSMFLFTTFAGIEKSSLGPVWFSAVASEAQRLIFIR